PPRVQRLAFGVLADTHLRVSRAGGYDGRNWPDRYLSAALRFFRDSNVDAVVHCGDMADRGVVEEMQFHADAWRRAFPDGRAADGRRVERLFVNGNHDVEGGGYGRGFRVEHVWPDAAERARHLLSTDMAGNWERIWGERYEPVWHREVGGYSFFGMNWGAGEANLKRLIDAKSAACGLKDGARPFFFVTHDRTHGAFNKGIRGYRNAFGFWGHWHMSAANWSTIQMLGGTVPSVQCPAAYPYFNNGEWLGGGDSWITKAPIEGELAGGRWRQGLLVRVYDDMLSIERREFSEGGSLGALWVARDWGFGKVGSGRHPFSREELKKAIGEPQFREGAELAVARRA
ncbi:MAG: metallophosphoesterase, partial [Kiritimatiellae bacterium]|nr:metallophosphoesterase [Kiritimatiellia bacterium]